MAHLNIAIAKNKTESFENIIEKLYAGQMVKMENEIIESSALEKWVYFRSGHFTTLKR